VGRHKQIFDYWLNYHATEAEKLLPYEEQCHAIQLWLQAEENWRKTIEELEAYDAYGNPPARKSGD